MVSLKYPIVSHGSTRTFFRKVFPHGSSVLFGTLAVPGIDDYVGSAQTRGVIGQRDLQGLRCDESAGAKNDFGSGLSVVLEIDVVPTG